MIIELKDPASSGAEEDNVDEYGSSRTALNGTDFRRGTAHRRTTGF